MINDGGRLEVERLKERKFGVCSGRLRVELRGGLGNQLFPWATGYAISKDNGLDLGLKSFGNNIDLGARELHRS
jgi:hypothetical protein